MLITLPSQRHPVITSGAQVAFCSEDSHLHHRSACREGTGGAIAQRLFVRNKLMQILFVQSCLSALTGRADSWLGVGHGLSKLGEKAWG